MKFLALLLVCCLAQDINGASVTIGSYINTVGKQIDALMADKQKQANAAAGSTVKLPTAPKLPTPNNPDQVIVNPPKPPLPNPKCDLKGLTALLKAMFGRVKGSCSNVKKSKGPLAGQCNAAKANFTTEFKVMEKVTENISYEFSSCSEKVNPAINDFVSNVGKIFDSISAASTATDTKKCGKDVNVSVKNMAIMLKLLFESMNSVTGSAKPAAGTNAADAVATSEVFLSNILLHVKVILDLVSSASAELSLESSEIVKTLSQTVEALSTKCADGKVKILGSVCIEFTASLTVIIKSESSVNLEELTEECTSIDTELGKLTDSASEIEPPSSGETSAETPSSGETSAEKPSSAETSGETPSSGETSGETSTSPEETTEKPTSADLLIKISANIKVSIESITKSCGPLKTDVPGMGGKADASLSNVGAALTSLLSTIQSSGTLSVIELSTKIDAAIAAFIQSLTELINVFTSLKDSLSKDTSVAGTTAVSALDVIMKTIISISVKVTKATSVIVDKSNLFVTVTLDAVVAALGEINVESLDAKKTVSDLTEITSPKELNAESCTKVVEKLGKCSTEAVGKIKSKDSAKFNLRISFIFNAFGYTLQKLKVPKVCSGITSLQTNFSVLIKELFASLSCAEASKAEGGSAQDETKNGSGGSSPEKSSEEGADKKSKCKEIAPDRFKLVVTAILSILDASKSITADKSLDPKVLETFNQILKAFLTSVTEILTGLSTAVSEQTIDVSILLSISVETLTKATSGAEVDFGTLSTDVDGLLCYGNTVDTAKPALDDVKKIETDISKPEPAEGETKATFSKLSTSVSAALTILSKSVTSFNKYYSTPVDAVGKAVTKISSSITAFIRKATATTEVSVLLQDFLVEISLSIVELTDAYTKCSANTELDPKGYNAQFALNYVVKSTITIINSLFISFKIYITDIPTECTDFYTGVSDAVSADAGSPDTDPSELGEKVKGVCNKFNKDKGGSNESGGDSNGSGGDDGSAGDEGSGAGTGSAGDEGSAGDGGSAGDEGSAGDGVSAGDGASGED